MKVNPTNLVRRSTIISIIVVWILNCHYTNARDVQKRQIFREQVLPHVGGKIPDTAFETDRLALNRLQKEGIAIPDGVLLEQRNPQVFQYPNKNLKPVYRVKQTADNRYTPFEGKYHNADHSVETTYSLPQIAHHNIVVPKDAMIPVHNRLLLPNPLREGHPKIQEIDTLKNSLQQQQQQPQQHNIYKPENHPNGNYGSNTIHPTNLVYTPKPANIYPTYVQMNPSIWHSPAAISYQHHSPPSSSYDWNSFQSYEERTNQILRDFDKFFKQISRVSYPTTNHLQTPPVYYYNH